MCPAAWPSCTWAPSLWGNSTRPGEGTGGSRMQAPTWLCPGPLTHMVTTPVLQASLAEMGKRRHRDGGNCLHWAAP